jgi:scyllo-inositol 2-dehydrogenase (NADP+)
MNDKPLGLMVAGYGYSARTFHLPLIQGFPQLKVQVLLSSKEARDLPSSPEWEITKDYHQGLLRPEVEAVVITGPNGVHYPMAKEALIAGKHVVVEKPLCVTAGEAQELIDLSRRADLVLSVFQNRRLDGDFLTLEAMVKKGTLGQIKRIESRMDRYRPEVKTRWKEGSELGNGVFYDLGAHLIDQALCLFGPPKDYDGRLLVQREGGKGIDGFELTLNYPWGPYILGSSSLCHHHPFRFLVFGTSGTWQKQGWDPQEDRLKGAAIPQETSELFQQGQKKNHPILPGRYEDFYQDFYQAVRGGKASAFAPQTSLEGIRIIESLSIS